MAAQVSHAIERRESTEAHLAMLNQKIAGCSVVQIIMGTRRHLRKEREVFISKEYLPASQEHIMHIATESRLERCAGPFDIAGIGLTNQAGALACGTEIVGISARIGRQSLDDNPTA